MFLTSDIRFTTGLKIHPFWSEIKREIKTLGGRSVELMFELKGWKQGTKMNGS